MNDPEREFLHKDLPSLLNMLESKNNASGRVSELNLICLPRFLFFNLKENYFTSNNNCWKVK